MFKNKLHIILLGLLLLGWGITSCNNQDEPEVDPTLTASASTLSDFVATVNSPSDAKTLTINGANLKNNVTLTTAGTFEVATDPNSYGSSVTLTPTNGTVTDITIYLRLKSGLTEGAKTGTLTVTTQGIDDISVTLSGMVTADNTTPTFTTSTTSITGLTSTNTAASDAKSFTVMGANMNESVGVTLTNTTDFEFSIDGVSTFVSAEQTLTVSIGSIASTTVMVRLKSGLDVGTKSGKIEFSNSEITTVSVDLAGEVTQDNTGIQITFGNFDQNTQEVTSWTVPDGGADGYVIAINNTNSFTNLTDGDDPIAATQYNGSGQQIVYNGTSITAFSVSLLSASTTYYFKVYPYSGSRVYDTQANNQGNTATSSCSTSSTTESQICYSISSTLRSITSNNFPDYTPAGPSAGVSVATYTMPISPAQASSVTSVYDRGPSYIFGVALNGVKIDPIANEYFVNTSTSESNRDWNQEATFAANGLGIKDGAHFQSLDGVNVYHYHGEPTQIVSGISSSSHSTIVGFAGDGFPIYYKYAYTDANDATSAIKELKSSYQLRSGARGGDGVSAPDGNYDGTYTQDYEYVNGLGDLDECNGRFGKTPEFPNGTYYYVITGDWPFIPRCFRGTPDNSFKLGGR